MKVISILYASSIINNNNNFLDIQKYSFDKFLLHGSNTISFEMGLFYGKPNETNEPSTFISHTIDLQNECSKKDISYVDFKNINIEKMIDLIACYMIANPDKYLFTTPDIFLLEPLDISKYENKFYSFIPQKSYNIEYHPSSFMLYLDTTKNIMLRETNIFIRSLLYLQANQNKYINDFEIVDGNDSF